MPKEFLRKCKDCGNDFMSSSNKSWICPICLEKHKKEATERYNENHKKPKPKNKRHKSVISLSETVSLIEQYNQENGTNYTYGRCPFTPEQLKKIMKGS